MTVTCTCWPEECEGGRDLDDPKVCRYCLQLDCELPCPADLMGVWESA
jgi:hypothetical protein